jgi:ubiquinone/menaquinone biosynthesis C-methylase UbiE
MEKIEMSSKPVGTREWYDFIGQLADTLPGIHMGGQDATRKLLDLCQPDATSRVLDVGCGAGHTACLIAQQVGSQVYGIDISEVMIEKAKEKASQQGLTDRVDFRVGDACQLPFEDGLFDLVIIESVLTPLPGDKKQALNEMMRVLRPGGLIGANESTVDPSAPPELLKAFAQHPATYGHFTPQTLRSLFEEMGLQEIQMIEAKSVDTPSPLKGMGLRGLLSFMIRTYPKIILTLLRDARFREASRIDSAITKAGKQYMGYALIVGQKPG